MICTWLSFTIPTLTHTKCADTHLHVLMHEWEDKKTAVIINFLGPKEKTTPDLNPDGLNVNYLQQVTEGKCVQNLFLEVHTGIAYGSPAQEISPQLIKDSRNKPFCRNLEVRKPKLQSNRPLREEPVQGGKKEKICLLPCKLSPWRRVG